MTTQFVDSVEEMFNQPQIFRASEGLVNLGAARESKIDPNEEHHSRIGKGDEKDRFCELVASANSPNLTEGGITIELTEKMCSFLQTES